MKKSVALAAFALAALVFSTANSEAGCGGRGWWGYSQVPAYRSYSYSPAPTRTAAGPYSYRSYSYGPGVVPTGYQYYAPSRESAPRGADDFPANRKMFGLSN